MSQPAPRSPQIRSFLAWVWAGLLIVAGLGFVALNTGLIRYSGPLLLPVAGALVLLSVPFFARWLARRAEWWALITGWVFFALALLLGVIFLNPSPPQLVGVAALIELALPFGVVYLANRRRWWALIAAYALAALAGLLALTMFTAAPSALAAFALLAAALPFWLVYMLNRANWWAVIPAGALSAIAVLLLVAVSVLQLGSRGLAVVLNAAIALVCLAVWLTVRRLDLALWLAIGFALAAVMSVWFPPGTGWAVVALIGGVYIAVRQIIAARKRQTAAQPPQAAPAAPPQPAQAAAPPAPPVVTAAAPPAAPAGLQADREATQSQQRGAGSAPVVEFRPLDPFKKRREEGEK